ncbi:nicotinate-nucleotide--dimethylbenzimidazole phosphoribosyltransferase [Streptomyces sp. NPDC004065]|uniref:nicotinate-nucleotide--dimethylbenzimidazole phosphoribosyltransferase n=1 Tax=Streptomyces sp. NPDC004065 TaxID=3364689 RepID=UPI0038508148
MTDTGQVPGEGQPESAGMVEQPGVPPHGAYTYLSGTPAEDEDLLLPGSQGAWGNEVPPPAPEPVVEAVHEPGPHETSGRDSGSVDLGGVLHPDPGHTPAGTPVPPAVTPMPAGAAPQRRPLHLGPPTPDASASPVRSLADRGPAGAPVRRPGTAAPGPEYLDAPQSPEGAPQGAAPWGAQAAQAAVAVSPVPGVGAGATAVGTVVPDAEPGDAAQAAVARLAAEAGATGYGRPEARGEHGAAPAGTPAVSGPEDGHAAPAEPAHAAQGVEGPAGGDLPEGAADSRTGEDATAVPAAEAGHEAADATGSAAAPAGAPAAGADRVPGAPGTGAGEGAEGAASPQSAPETEAVPTAEAAQAAPAGEAAQAPDAARTADAAQAAPDPTQASDPSQAADASVADVAQVADAAQVAGAVPAADAAQVSDAVPAPDAAQVTVAAQAPHADPAADAAQVSDAAHAADAAKVPDATQVTEAAQAPVDPGWEPAQAVARAAAGEAGQTPQAAEPGPAPGDSGTPEQAEGAQTQDAAPEPSPAAGAAAVHGDGAAHTQEAADAPRAGTPAGTAPAGAEGFPAPGDAQGPLPGAAVETAGAPAPPGDPIVEADAHHPDAELPAPTQQATTGEAAPMPAAEHTGHVPAPEHPQATPPAGPADAPAAPSAEPAGAGTATDPETVGPVAAAGTPAAGTPTAGAPDEQPPVEQPPGEQAPVGPPLVEHTPGEQTQGEHPGAVLPTTVPSVPAADQPLGQFVPVEGSVPTTPHLAPAPPHPAVPPAGQEQADTVPEAPQGPVVTVPAPRDGDLAAVPGQDAAGPEPVQHADDLDTRGAEPGEPGEPAGQRQGQGQEQEQGQAAEEGTTEEGTAEAPARQSSGPAAPGYDEAEREAVLKVMRERRDIRNGFRGDPIPHEVLLRVLEAAHTAPSVGHSQPWDFVVIRSAETRRTMHELAMRQREAYAKSLPKGRAKQFKELKIEAILDTPVNIVVTADPTRGGRHTLGRHTQPQMAPYSAALAVENLWLAARAEGLGVGWVSFFDEREMVRALGLPEHLEVIAYLCVGYVDEFPDEPELMQAGWSKRRPLSWVVHEETYGRRALPGEDPHDLLAETVAQIRPLDAKALGEAWERQKRMTKPAGALGMLEIISAQLSGLSRQCPPPIPEPAAVAIFAGDHGVHAQGVTPWPQEVTAQMVANFLGGGAVCNAFAGQVGAEVCVIDVGVAADLPATPGLLPRKIRAGTSDMTTGPAMTREEAKKAIEVGIETARDLVAAGNKALLTGEMGIANTTASAALIAVYTGADPSEVTGRGTGINDETLARKTEVVRRALEVHRPDPADPIGVLAAIGGFEHAAMVGLLLGGASLRTPVILDGVSAGAAALVARAIAPEVLAACIAGHRSAEPGHVAALNKLGLRPLVDLDLRLGEGTGALLALPLVQSTARAMHEVATFDSAGVTEK